MRIGLSLLVDTRFQVFSPPSPGCFSPFPRGTCPLSVSQEYLGLRDGPRRFRQDFTCPVLLGVPAGLARVFVYGTLTLFRRPFHAGSTNARKCLPRPLYPARISSVGLASSPFARHYSGNHSCFLLLQVLRCFTSLGSLLPAYLFSRGYAGITQRGFPHSDIPGSLPGWRLPETFRSLPRPSSPLTA